MAITLVVFDLDGTLVDSSQDLAQSANAARSHLGLAPLSQAQVMSYVGNGAPMLIRRVLGKGASESQIQAALAFFLDYYHQHMLDATVLYPGVAEVLDQLQAGGIGMAVLTNKPAHLSESILDGLKIRRHFFRVCGGDTFPQKKPDPVGIETLMAEAKVARDSTMMVGDSQIDIKTARNAGVIGCGVTFGLQPETLKLEVPDISIDDMRQLVPHVLGLE